MIVEEQLRVTKVFYSSSNLVIFNGVPFKPDSYRINSGKYFVSVKAGPETLAVPPVVGQHWVVRGKRTFHDIVVENTNYLREMYLTMVREFKSLQADHYLSPHVDNRKSQILHEITEKDHEQLVKAAKAGNISYRETFLGGCANYLEKRRLVSGVLYSPYL
jgi:hypothetical protein